jgi:hypothetical protein
MKEAPTAPPTAASAEQSPAHDQAHTDSENTPKADKQAGATAATEKLRKPTYGAAQLPLVPCQSAL